jgi:uncharacterized protein (TIGR03118 family)
MKISLLPATAVLMLAASAALACNGGYRKEVFVASKSRYKPTLGVERAMENAWGIAIRPRGAGGHFWVTAGDTSYEYVGDVREAGDPALRKLYQDNLKEVKLPVGGKGSVATGVVFSNSRDAFVITQDVEGKEPITAPAKFMFASDGGIISAWTERRTDKGFDRSGVALPVIDRSAQGARFFGLAINRDNDRIYAADFGANPGIAVFDAGFKPADVTFATPFDENGNGRVDAGEYAPFNIQAVEDAHGKSRLFVTYAKTRPCPKAAVKKGLCEPGGIYPGEEDTGRPGQGRLAEFEEDGTLVKVWDDAGKLSAPWGLAYAPEGFGELSGQLLVGNFGNGTIAAFDPQTQRFTSLMSDAAGKPLVIEGLWGLLFGNGESLGDGKALYYAAGPEDEKGGVFGSLRYAKAHQPVFTR